MIPGPDIIISCPHCKGLAKHMSLVSGNTFGAKLWTDGKQIAPMLPRPPAVVKCCHCRGFYWLHQAKAIGKVSWETSDWQPPRLNRESAPEIKELTEKEYYAAIEAKLAKTKAEEIALRRLAWWRKNDAFRGRARKNDGKVGVPKGAASANLQALVGLIPGTRMSDRIMKAEILRELGEFKSAIKVLTTVTASNYSWVVRQIKELCKSKNTRVKELKFDN